MGFWNFIGLPSRKEYQKLEESLSKTTELLEGSIEQGLEIKKSMVLLEDSFNESLKTIAMKLNEGFNSVKEESAKNTAHFDQIILNSNQSLSEQVLNELSNQSEKNVDHYQKLKSLHDNSAKLEKTILDTSISSTKELKLKINEKNQEIVNHNRKIGRLEERTDNISIDFKEGINDINLKSEDIKRRILETIEDGVTKNKESITKNNKMMSKELSEYINQISIQNFDNSEKLRNLEILNENITEAIKMILVNNVLEDLKTVDVKGA